MKVSYKWINQYLNGKAPTPEKIADLLTMHSMEVEDMEKVGEDMVLNVKTLPNNNHSCLCHRGIAREIGTVANINVNLYSRVFKDVLVSKTSKDLSVKIEDGKLCRRYIGRVVENIEVKESPDWLKTKLETLGQRSINNIVDATNFVMLEIGQPMHAFDSDKIGSEIVVKNAYRGQRIVTLDKKDVELDEDVLLITDGENPLAIAGIKGGNYAELEMNTKNIILESANFDPVLIRKTAQRIKIQTDASKRYENDFSAEIASDAMDILTKLIVEIAGTKDTKVGEFIDNYPTKAEKVELGISAREASDIIGVEIKDSDVEDIFNRFNFEWKKVGDKFVITVPDERLDLRIKEDLAEEIGRIFGYEKINDVPLSKNKEIVKIDKGFAYKEKIRRVLYEQGFSEVINYTFVSKGEIELANPMSPERKYLRTNLRDGMMNCLELNSWNNELVITPPIGKPADIRVFEFGHVFKNNTEYTSMSLGWDSDARSGKKTSVIEKEIKLEAINLINIIKNFGCNLVIKEEENSFDIFLDSELIGSHISNTKIQNGNIGYTKIKTINGFGILEINFEKILEKLPEITNYDFSEVGDKNKKYKKISQYPYMIRDIAVFTPEGTKLEEPLSIINKEAGSLMIKNRLFDVFTKTMEDGTKKTSYAYRIIFQSYEKTLSDEEVNTIMTKITDLMNLKKGWQVR